MQIYKHLFRSRIRSPIYGDAIAARGSTVSRPDQQLEVCSIDSIGSVVEPDKDFLSCHVIGG